MCEIQAQGLQDRNRRTWIWMGNVIPASSCLACVLAQVRAPLTYTETVNDCSNDCCHPCPSLPASAGIHGSDVLGDILLLVYILENYNKIMMDPVLTFILFYGCSASMYLYAWKGIRTLEVELPTVVSRQVGAGTWTRAASTISPYFSSPSR